uniref:Bile salt export pump n=1 Tax=Ciona savignyi TaxID=51511 RepID=H2ZPB8_CIOSA
FRYADSLDIFLMIVGSLTGAIHGAGLSAFFIIFGKLTSEVWNATIAPEFYAFKDKSVKFVLYFVYVACAVVVFASIQVGTWSLAATRQSKHIRTEYFRSVLRQDMAFHDVKSSGELNARLSKYYIGLQTIYYSKDRYNRILTFECPVIQILVSMVIQYGSMSLTGIIVGFCYTWKLALVTLAVAPLLGIASGLMFTVTATYTKKELAAYATAGTIAEEAISAIRTVVAFGCQDREVDRYTHNLGDAKVVGIKGGLFTGFSMGLLYLSMFGMYGLSFWYGTTLVLNGEIAVGNMITSFLNILIAAFALGMGGSYLEALSAAKAAGYNIFDIIDRKPVIDPFSKDGDSPNPDSGSIQLKNVRFTYPSRPEVEILKGVSLTVEHGKTVAFVGQSGCGKSTIIQLIQRFYDVQEGSLEVGAKDVSTLNVRKLREMIGVVAQEPILFATSIAENIRWGREGVTNEEIEEAARQANAYNFIMNLPEKFQTLVGERGGQMSGGQKQRIAIARAIVRNPKVLLLDEATSALDTKSESVVQQALEKASAGRTTVVVAHRLSTIRSADKIFALHEGQIMEEGSHEELLLIKDGVYSNLINMQAGRESEEDTLPLATLPQPQCCISKKSGKIGEDDEEEEEEDIPDVSFGRIIAMNKPEWYYMAAGCVFAAIAGAADPVNAILFAEVLTVFSLSDVEEQKSKATLYALLFFALGVTVFIAYCSESTLFAKSGMELTVRLRKKAFKAMLRQDIAYFDDHRHSPGALCTRLSMDASRVQGCTGVRIGTIIKNFSSLGVALGIAFAFGWKLTLLTIAFIPFLVVGGLIEMQLHSFTFVYITYITCDQLHIKGSLNTQLAAYATAGTIAEEAISAIRTVVAFGCQDREVDRYTHNLGDAKVVGIKGGLFTGFSMGLLYLSMFGMYGLSFWYGTTLVLNGEIAVGNMIVTFFNILIAAFGLGMGGSYLEALSAAKAAGFNIFDIIDRKPVIDPFSKEGDSPNPDSGSIQLKNVCFTYPSRPDVKILKGVSLTVEHGKTVALVGQSGCGKSTIIQLIQRFYDVQEGSLEVGGKDVSTLNVRKLREVIGVVAQEPILFATSIAENIRWGREGVTNEEIEEAARQANAYNFIMNLPEKFQTLVGERGGQMSGGQKQRIAIARAIVRNPKVLLLDEATSALDTKSESVVQQALEKASAGRTTVVVAHRLSTIRSADKIFAFHEGQIMEEGSHEELLLIKDGVYSNLINMQAGRESEE